MAGVVSFSGREGTEDRPVPKPDGSKSGGPGPLVVIGGAEDRDGGILRSFVTLAGGRDAVVAILATASDEPEGAEEAYVEAFGRLGVRRVLTLRVAERGDAGRADILRQAEQASGFFFTGGDQLRITSTIGGTALDALLHRKLGLGVVIAGTSAGASAMSETMIVAGDDDDAPKNCTIKMAPGMGFLKGTVVDQHFAQRGRIGRLLTALAQNPSVLGLGVDEDTAAVVFPDRTLRVLGSQTVTVLDGRTIAETNATESLPDEPLALTDVVLHVLPSGYGFDLKSRRPLRLSRREMESLP
ncbi:MAG: cyanophycinase [Bacillota bacterium]|jgi:cyanophycinase|nr:MAG: cyanophycinase [Bacillota bacterium]